MKDEKGKDSLHYTLHDLHFEFDLSKAKYSLDALQNRILQTYIRQDRRFRKAFSTNFTAEFLQFLKDKARLKEPIHLSVIGQTRSGKSIIPETKVLYIQNNHLKVMSIKDLFNVYRYKGKILTPSINLKTNKIELKEITGITRHKYKDKIYKITLHSGRIIEATKHHSFLILDKLSNKIIERKGEELKENDFIPIANKLPFKENIKKIDIIHYWNKNTQNTLIKKFDKPLKLNWDFGFFLGAFLSEGCVTSKPNNCIHISNNDKIFTQILKKFSKKIGTGYGIAYDKRRNSTSLQIFSSVLAEFLRQTCYNFYLGEENKERKGYYSAIKKFPDFVLFSPQEFKKGLLCGLFSGDSYLGLLGTKISLEYCSKSKDLISDVALLLISLGFSVKFRRKILRTGKYAGSIYYIINIQNRNILKFIKEIGFKTARKIKLAKKIQKRYKKIENNLLDRINLEEFYFSKIKKIKDLLFDEIIKIETYDYNDLVYDISVKDNKNFMLANGSFVHNSYSSITIASILMALYGKEFTIDYICGNSIEYLEKLKAMPEEKLIDTCFLIDEEKNFFGIGSLAKKVKLQDVANIIAINNISTIMLNPISWADRESHYGLRCFGRCFDTKTNRFMLYNLQSKGHEAELPMGNLFIPTFTSFLPKDYAVELERQYLLKKREWVRGEMRGENDVLYEIKRKSAENFMRDNNFLSLKKKGEQLAYIGLKLGSEWTKGEIDEIYQITKLIRQGINL